VNAAAREAKYMRNGETSCKCPGADGKKQSTGIKGPMLAAMVIAGLLLWYVVYGKLKPAADFITYRLLGIAENTRFGESTAFFIYDVPKVLMLLVLVIFGVGVIRSFFTPERTRRILAGKREFLGNILAASLGIITPFCTCSACPLFIGFVKAGIPLGVTFSFLIAAPMINEVAVVLLYGMFGWKVASLYTGTGLLIAIVAGMIIGRLHMEGFVEDWIRESGITSAQDELSGLPWEGRVQYGLESVREIVGRVWPFIVLGIAVGAGIHGYVPEGLMAGIMGKSAWWSVPAAILIGVPMYSNAAGIIPVVQALMEKGAALGTVLAFMMAVIGLSLPEIIILRRVLKWQLIATFVGVVATGILLVGLLFNTMF
jgi:uncharacterized membrane protein YraQ (UPF0718 family)